MLISEGAHDNLFETGTVILRMTIGDLDGWTSIDVFKVTVTAHTRHIHRELLHSNGYSFYDLGYDLRKSPVGLLV